MGSERSGYDAMMAPKRHYLAHPQPQSGLHSRSRGCGGGGDSTPHTILAKNCSNYRDRAQSQRHYVAVTWWKQSVKLSVVCLSKR
eukprot:gene3750-8367_t